MRSSGMLVCERIFDLYPEYLEGEMTKVKSTVVSRQTCAEIACAMGLDQQLRLGKGMRGQDDLPVSLSAAVLESVLAALYIDGGMEAVRALMEPVLDPIIRRAAASGHQENFKSVLQQFAQQQCNDTPSYVVLDEKGPDHAKCFEVSVEIGTRRFPSSWGASKKQAEQMAALNALVELGITTEDEDGHLRVLSDCEIAELVREGEVRPVAAEGEGEGE